MIIQGSNEPVIVEFCVDHEIKKVDMALFDSNDVLIKEWNFDGGDIINNIVTAPLDENETMEFPCGVLSLEVKWLDGNDSIWHGNVITVRCSKRSDKRQMLGGGDNA